MNAHRFFFLLIALMLHSQLTLAQTSISNLDVAITEQRFDAIANEALSHFFNPGTYRVSVRLSMSQSTVSRTRIAESESSEAVASEGLPALPFYQRGVESEIRRPATPIPVEPRSQSQPQVSIRSMSVTLWLSDELDDAQADFASRVVSDALKIDVGRGDRLLTQRESMPMRGAATDETQLQGGVPKSIPLTQKKPFEMTTRMSLLSLLGLALLILPLLIWRYRVKKAKMLQADPEIDEMDFNGKSIPLPPVPAGSSSSTAPTSALGGDPQFNVGRVTLSHLDNRIDSMEFLLHVFMIHAEEIARLMESWISTDSIAGTERVVNVLQLVDPKFLNAFKPYMSAAAFHRIERTMVLKSEAGVSKAAIDVLETMAQDVKKRFRIEHGTVRLIALQQFDFVNHIEDKVLMMLLEKQSAETCALVLYHLDSVRASSILSSLPQELAEETLLLIPLVRGMEFAVYNRIAKQVFDAYHDWMRSQSLVTKGLMQTVFILESLTEEFRIPYLDTMSVVDPVWSAKIRHHLITEETLDAVPDTLLHPAVLNVNLDRFSILAASVPDSLAQRMIAIRTPREQARLREIRLDSSSIPDAVRRREMADFVTLLRNERTRSVDSSYAA